jgi:hypothetical protein
MSLKALLCLLLLAAPLAGAQEDSPAQSIPGVLWQPGRGESPRYPRDLVIGSLARGNVGEGARQAAAQALSALTAGNRNAAIFSSLAAADRNGLFAAVAGVEPRRYRVGEGRAEADGSYSFLVRFIGREQGIAGELYLRFEEPPEAGASGGGRWLVDDLLLEEARPLGEYSGEDAYNLPPYERLF